MKKTLITLLALAGVAVGGTKESIALNSDKTAPIIATSELTLDNLTAIISDTSVRSTLIGLTVVRNEGAENEERYQWSVAANYWGVSNELHIYEKEAAESVSGNANGSFGDSTWPSAHKLSNAFTLEGAVKGAITLGYAGTDATMALDGTAVVLSVLYDDGTIKSIYGINTAYKYSKDSIDYLTYNSDLLNTPTITIGTDWTKDSLIEITEAAIPEPTTATLSLLALCGLAARRRRR